MVELKEISSIRKFLTLLLTFSNYGEKRAIFATSALLNYY